MNTDEMLAALEANAARTRKAVQVDVTNVGTLFVRQRTIGEVEDMASIQDGAKLARALARLLCDEDGNRYSEEVQARLADVLTRQPDSVLHLITAAADGKKDEATGN